MKRKRTTLEIDADLIAWHKNLFPEISLSATINALLRSYKNEYDVDPPDNYYLRGARHLKEQIENDLKTLEE